MVYTSKNKTFMINFKGTGNRIFGTGVQKQFLEFSETVWSFNIYIKVLTTLIMIYLHSSST